MAAARADARAGRRKGPTHAPLAALALSILACSHDWTVRPRAAEVTDAAADGPTLGEDAGGGSQARLTELTSGELGTGELVVVGETLVWTVAEPSRGAIRACRVDDCRPRSLATAQDVPRSLIVEGPHVMWVVGRETRRTGLDGAAVSVVMAIDKPLQAVRRIGETLYASDPDYVARCDFDETSAVCTGRSTIGAEPSASSLGPLAVDPRQRLWVANRDAVYLVDLDVARRRSWSSADRARALVASDALVVALLEDGDVVAASTSGGGDGGAPRSVRGAGTASAIAIDQTHLYVGYTDGRIDRHALSKIDEGEPIGSALGDVRGLAVDRNRIYVALADGRIGALPKPSAAP